jgi:hypothetical protein
MANKVSATKTVTAKGATCQTVEAAASMEAVEASTAYAEAPSMEAVEASTAYAEATATTSVEASTAYVEAATASVSAATASVSAATTSVSAATVPATVLARCNRWGKSDRCTDCGDGGNADERFSEHGSVSSLERCPGAALAMEAYMALNAR